MNNADANAPVCLPARWQPDWILLGLLLVSLALRGELVRRGGTGFWSDENRYNMALDAARDLRAGQVADAVHLLLANPDHMGYKAAMTLPAWAQLARSWGNGWVVWLGSGLFSALNIGWVYALALRLGGTRGEARWSALFMAGSASMFYWSRHLMPYDMALFWGLACLFVALHPAARWWHSLLAGFFGFLSFVTYNGAWLPVAFALVVHVLRAWPSWKRMLVRAGWGLIGLGGTMGLLVWGALWLELDLLTAYQAFAGTVTQGDFSDGHRVLLGYLWKTEHGLLLMWIGGMLFFLHRAFRREPDLGRPKIWFAGIVTIGAALVIFSNLLGIFVVYGRLARQTVPFLALLGGWALAQLIPGSRGGPWLKPALALVIVILAAANFARPWTQVFPDRFSREGNLLIKSYLQKISGEAEVKHNAERFKFLNVGFIWPMPEHYDLPPHEVLLQRLHPLQYEPYLYEGFNRDQRAAIHETDISMRLILIKD
jgi:hypothetical protein